MSDGRVITFAEAVREGLDLALARYPEAYVIGEGVPDPKAIFGTTKGLGDRHGHERVMDMPLSENGMTGMAIGSALHGMRPILVHQRFDFALLSVDQIVNNAAKWHYMFGGKMNVPLVIRMVIGRGWGQGPQHSQNLAAWFAHVPGLKVVMPERPADAKGLLLSAIADENPVIYLEHRWLHNVTGHVDEGWATTPIGEARVVRQGRDVTLVGSSHVGLENLRAAEILSAHGIEAEVIDLRTLRPLDTAAVVASVRKTGRLVAADDAWRPCGMAGEVLACVAEQAFDALTGPPVRITFPDHPTPTSPALSAGFYPRAADVVAAVAGLLERPIELSSNGSNSDLPHDVPDPSFTGPF